MEPFCIKYRPISFYFQCRRVPIDISTTVTFDLHCWALIGNNWLLICWISSIIKEITILSPIQNSSNHLYLVPTHSLINVDANRPLICRNIFIIPYNSSLYVIFYYVFRYRRVTIIDTATCHIPQESSRRVDTYRLLIYRNIFIIPYNSRLYVIFYYVFRYRRVPIIDTATCHIPQESSQGVDTDRLLDCQIPSIIKDFMAENVFYRPLTPRIPFFPRMHCLRALPLDHFRLTINQPYTLTLT